MAIKRIRGVTPCQQARKRIRLKSTLRFIEARQYEWVHWATPRMISLVLPPLLHSVYALYIRFMITLGIIICVYEDECLNIICSYGHTIQSKRNWAFNSYNLAVCRWGSIFQFSFNFHVLVFSRPSIYNVKRKFELSSDLKWFTHVVVRNHFRVFFFISTFLIFLIFAVADWSYTTYQHWLLFLLRFSWSC